MDELVRLFKDISIRAPVKGATHHSHHQRMADNHFNPCSREGSDVQCMVVGVVGNVFQSALP